MVPNFVARTRGGKWVQALPAGSKWNRALPGPHCLKKKIFSNRSNPDPRGGV